MGKMVWYSPLYKTFPQLIMIHIVKGFGIVNKAEIDIGNISVRNSALSKGMKRARIGLHLGKYKITFFLFLIIYKNSI